MPEKNSGVSREKNNGLRTQFERLINRHIMTLKNDSMKGIMAFTPSLVPDVSHVLGNYVRRNGVLTFIVSGRGRWNPRESYFERVRELARKGVSINRLFLLPQRILLTLRLDLFRGAGQWGCPGSMILF